MCPRPLTTVRDSAGANGTILALVRLSNLMQSSSSINSLFTQHSALVGG